MLLDDFLCLSMNISHGHVLVLNITHRQQLLAGGHQNNLCEFLTVPLFLSLVNQ